jgi:hypothetical protein
MTIRRLASSLNHASLSALQAIDDRAHLAHAADDAAIGIKAAEMRGPRRPGAVGVDGTGATINAANGDVLTVSNDTVNIAANATVTITGTGN